MAKCAIFITTEAQRKNALEVLEELHRSDIEVYLTHPLWVPNEAMEIVRRENIQVIIARGGVALEFKKCTTLPVVDLVVAVQELGMLLVEAKSLLKKECPTIAFVSYKNMICDTSDVDTLFGVRLRTYFVTSLDEMEPTTRIAAQDGADLVIGGVYVRATCKELSLPFIENPAGTASIRQALLVASHVSYTIDAQQRINSETHTLLNFSFNGLIKLNAEGLITTMNHRAESLLDFSESEALGKHISLFFPSIDTEQLSTQVFIEGDELFSTYWAANGEAIAVSIAPILVDGKVDSAILSCYDIDKMSNFEKAARHDLYQGSEDNSRYTYKWLAAQTDENTSFLRRLNNYAQYDECVLLQSPHSAERRYCAKFIHENGLRRDCAFTEISAAAYISGEHQLESIFESGVLSSSDGGTLFIDELEKLSPEGQQRLLRLIEDRLLISRVGAKPINVRVVVASAADLPELCAKGEFRQDLYYAISSASLIIPELCGCPNEIIKWATHYVSSFGEQYGHYVLLTKAARRVVAAQPWRGGHAELRCFCRMVALGISKRTLDETSTNRLLAQMENRNDAQAAKPLSSEMNAEETKIRALIEKHGSSRDIIADEMHMSKTTLWRRMKKYGLI